MKKNLLTEIIEKCDMYFEGSLISKEYIVKEYAEFFMKSIENEQSSVSIALHTGSVCFDVVSIIVVTLGCIYFDKTDADEIIISLEPGDMILYKDKRYKWCGIEQINESKKHMKIQKDASLSGKDGPLITSIPFEKKGLIRPYLGDSKITDGRGIKKTKADRKDFLSFVFGISKDEIPSITNVSTVIVTEYDIFKRIVDGLLIKYCKEKSISLIEIVTASYFTDSLEEEQYGDNPTKTEAVLKITSSVSTARDLVLDRKYNPTVGLLVISANAVEKGKSELADLLSRKSLKFAHIATNIDFIGAEGLIESYPNAPLFPCTNEIISNDLLPIRVENPHTIELERQIENIKGNTIEVIKVKNGCSWNDMRKAKEALQIIRRSSWSEEKKNNFIVYAYSLLNLFSTAVFSLSTMETAICGDKINVRVSSHKDRISRLWDLAESEDLMENYCLEVIDVIERFSKMIYEKCPKHDVLVEYLQLCVHEQIIIVVPKQFYNDLLLEDKLVTSCNVRVVTTNKFSADLVCDKVIVVGDINGKRFEPLKCKTTKNIVVLLYECEEQTFNYKRKKAHEFEKKLNIRGRAIRDLSHDEDENITENIDNDNLGLYIDSTEDLEQFIDEISIFDTRNFSTNGTDYVGNTLTTEVCVLGQFTSGEKILFSRYYRAVVYDSGQETVKEKEPEKLLEGDSLIFAERNDYTKNMVDYIYEGLQSKGKLSLEVLDSTEKVFYWKEALREYMRVNKVSYCGIAEALASMGSTLKEASVRQWLIDGSHIVGPREEKTLEMIANITNDPYLLKDTHAYFEACRVVRRQRKEILKLIGKAIVDKLRGQIPSRGSLLENVFENINSLSRTIEIENIKLLDAPIFVPVNFINKPILEEEMSI